MLPTGAFLFQLRQYLQSNRATLTLTSLFLYSLQVARAVAYLHEQSLVHRDIAARNVLVSNPKCVKLTDFGLSRALDYDAVYTGNFSAHPGSPFQMFALQLHEANFRLNGWLLNRSTTESSAWRRIYGCTVSGLLPCRHRRGLVVLFFRHNLKLLQGFQLLCSGVCIWEILSWGAKPWQGIANADVITRVESGGRLPCPDGCPAVVFNYLELMVWALQPQKRPTAKEIVSVSILISFSFLCFRTSVTGNDSSHARRMSVGSTIVGTACSCNCSAPPPPPMGLINLTMMILSPLLMLLGF